MSGIGGFYMYTQREKELHTYNDIEDYLNSMDNFHDYKLGNFEYDKASNICVCIETDHNPINSSKEGLVWDFNFEKVTDFSFSMDVMIGSWVDEITVETDSKIVFALTNGYISVSAEKIKLGIPSKT